MCDLLCSPIGSADRIYMWDLERESCVVQLSLPPASSSSGGGSSGGADHAASALPATTCLAASCNTPLLFAADASGAVRIFDLRSGGGPVGIAQHQRSRLSGLVVEPGGTPHLIVLGYPSAHLAFLDCRMLPADASVAAAGEPGQVTGRGGGGDRPRVRWLDWGGAHPASSVSVCCCCAAYACSPCHPPTPPLPTHPLTLQHRIEVGVWKSFDAHSKGPMTALAGHRTAPLLATATANQVVKVGGWGTRVRTRGLGLRQGHPVGESSSPVLPACACWLGGLTWL